MTPVAEIVIRLMPDGQVQCGSQNVDRLRLLGLLEFAKIELDKSLLKQAEGKVVLAQPFGHLPPRP